jgi:hypothetical protein
MDIRQYKDARGEEQGVVEHGVCVSDDDVQARTDELGYIATICRRWCLECSRYLPSFF